MRAHPTVSARCGRCRAAAITCRIAFGPRAGRKVLSFRGATPRKIAIRQPLALQSKASACVLRCGSRHAPSSGWISCAATLECTTSGPDRLNRRVPNGRGPSGTFPCRLTLSCWSSRILRRSLSATGRGIVPPRRNRQLLSRLRAALGALLPPPRPDALQEEPSKPPEGREQRVEQRLEKLDGANAWARFLNSAKP